MWCVCAGKGWSTKIDEVREKMKAKDCKGLVVTALDEVACKKRMNYMEAGGGGQLLHLCIS